MKEECRKKIREEEWRDEKHVCSINATERKT